MRILKKEIMDGQNEVADYDRVVTKYRDIVHAGFAQSVINLSPAAGGTFLDVGTGTGWDSILIAKYRPNVKIIAVDLSDPMLERARTNARNEGVAHRIKFIKGDAKCLPFGDGVFDAVFSQNMLHHQADPRKMILEIKRVVKRDGAVVIRDLIRYPRFVNQLCAGILGMNYDGQERHEYLKSIEAALSYEEWLMQQAILGLPGARLTRQFLTHVTIERPSPRRSRSRIEISSSWSQSLASFFYISKTKGTENDGQGREF